METPTAGSYARYVAVKTSISQILQGSLIQEPDEPSYLQTTDGHRLFRVNIMASVLSREKNGSVTSLLLDDGTGQITLRSFEESDKINLFDIGDIILIIGRVRSYNGEKYLTREIAKKISPGWLKVRKEEMKPPLEEPLTEEISEEIIQKRAKIKNEEQSKQPLFNQLEEKFLLPVEKIIKIIREFDRGSGIQIEEIIEKLPFQEVEPTIEKMLKEGLIYQIQPGRVKVL